MKRFLTGLTGVVLISACATAAKVSDTAIQKASWNRIQATPFSDMVSESECREQLPQIFGIHRESLEVQAGVRVAQTYECKGPNIVATVNLKNLNAHAVYCATFADNIETGAWVGPQGRAVYTYKYKYDSSLQCGSFG
jgi:hypothetical protein